MDRDAPRGLLRYFAELPDPRMNRTRRHRLSDILTLALCAVLCGADGWVQVAEFGRCKLNWFKTSLALPHGIPSHDTFGRVAERGRWKHLRSLARVETRRTINGRTSVEYRYCISSLDAQDPARMLERIRGHWGIENSLHRSLDISFREDDCRIRRGHAAENFSRLSRIALNLLKSETQAKVGIKTKRLRAGWDHDYLLKVLTQRD